MTYSPEKARLLLSQKDPHPDELVYVVRFCSDPTLKEEAFNRLESMPCNTNTEFRAIKEKVVGEFGSRAAEILERRGKERLQHLGIVARMSI